MRMRRIAAAALVVAIAACERAPSAADGAVPVRDASEVESAASPAAAEPTSPSPDAPSPSPSPASDADAPAAPGASATAAAVPARFRGRYAVDQAACGAAAHETRLEIDAERIRFHESAGAIERAESDGDTLALTATLTGEGQTRSADYRFRLSADGERLTDVSDGEGLARVRCE